MKSPVMKYEGLKRVIAVFAFIVVVCAIVIAENGNEDSNGVSTTVATPDTDSAVIEGSNPIESPANPVESPTNPVEDSNQQEPTLEERMMKTISIDFINTPIDDAIKMMAEQADVDYVKSPTVVGDVTATLTNVPLKEALNNILAVHGFGYVLDKNMISVKPLSEITQQEERLETRVYHITYADISEVETALNKFITKRGSMSSSKGTSDIIVKDVESNIKAIDDFISKIDRETPQVMVEVRIYDVTSTEGFDIGAEWDMGRNNPITSVSRTLTNTITDTVDTVTPANTGTVTAVGDATTETTNTAWQDSAAGATTSSYTYRKSNPFVGGAFAADTAGTIRIGFLDTVNAEITLNILRTQVGAKLLADPRILVLDNETAQFKIVSEIPYTETSDTSSGGSMTSTKFKEVGVELQVTPHVAKDDMVRLHIVPEFSVVSTLGNIIPNSGGLRGVPTVDARKADTTALVLSGQTVVLGGLRKRTVSQDVSKIPLLGDVPILGTLFSDVSEEVETNELIIFITPKIIDDEQTLTAEENKGLDATTFPGPKVSYTEDEKAEMRGK
jgi:type IV pilus assembly protein PilQ